MTSFLYRTPAEDLTGELTGVRARYDALSSDVASVATMPAADPALSAAAASVLLAEARLLDARRWGEWLARCADDAVLWVPLDTEDPRAGEGQSLLLDDRRRLDERVWRFTDPNAWALAPPGRVTRVVAGVEAWPVTSAEEPTGQEILVSSTLSLQHVRGDTVWATAGRQVHRLRADAEPEAQDSEWRLVHKVLLLPALRAGTPHLGWLL